MTSTFILNGKYFTSPNQSSPPVPFETQPLSVQCSPTALRNHVWALDGYPYLGFCDKLPFQDELLTSLAGSVEDMPLEHDRHGWHLHHETTKSWKQLEQSLRRIGAHLKRWFHAGSPKFPFYYLIEPESPSKFGYFTAHTTEDAARSGLQSSLDAFVVYSAYVSFLSALCQFIGGSAHQSSWLSPSMDPEVATLFKKSHIVDFSGERKRTGTIINVLKCGWIPVADVLLQAKVPMWLYWGDHPLMVTPKVGWMVDYRPQLVDLGLPVQSSLSSLPSAPLQSQPHSSTSELLSCRPSSKEQLPGETPKQYFIRRQNRNEARMKTETAQDKQVRANRERASAGRQCPGRRGPTVFYWESDDNGFRVRTLQTRRQVEDVWSTYSGPQKIFDSFENEWDCCTLFGDDDSSDDDDNFNPSTVPISTASNVIPANAIVSTSALPPPHNESTSMDLDAQFISHPSASVASENALTLTSALPTSALPPPHNESTSMDLDAQFISHPSASVASENALTLTSALHPSALPPPHNKSTSMDLDAQFISRPSASVASENALTLTSALPPEHEKSTPMDLDTQLLPSLSQYPPPVSSAPSNYDRCPRLSPGHDSHRYDCGTQPFGNSPERYDSRRRRSRDRHPPSLRSRDDSRRRFHRRSRDRHPPCRRSRDDSPSRFRRRSRDPRDDSPRRPFRYLQDGGERSLPCRSRSRGFYQRNPSTIVTSHPSQDLSAHPPDTRVTFGIQTDSVEDYVYHRFGFRLDENPYTGVPSSARTVKFHDWVEVLRSIGCHQLSSSSTNRQPIQEFLECLLSTDDPLRGVPIKFWDLNTKNGASLDLAAGLVRIEPKTFLGGKTLYLIIPVHASDSWVLAVDAITALECVRRRLGPHTTDIAKFLINRGIPFSTLRRMTSIPGPSTPPQPISNFLGTRPIKYRFNLADFSAYQSLYESVLRSKPFGRAALCVGGIVARLARDIIPITAALLGPSPDALEGSQQIMVCGGELFCDDKLSDPYTDLICGVYEVPTAHGSQVSKMSWFPRHNVWVQAGYNVGQWTQECEQWFEKRMTEIQEGGQPLDSHTWRSKLLLSRKAIKLVRKMDSAAASFIQAQNLDGGIEN